MGGRGHDTGDSPRARRDADFIARTILLAQRGPVPRGWFDIALAQAEPQVLDFIRALVVAKQRSWWHASQFWIAEVEGDPRPRFAACPRADHWRWRGLRSKKPRGTPA